MCFRFFSGFFAWKYTDLHYDEYEKRHIGLNVVGRYVDDGISGSIKWNFTCQGLPVRCLGNAHAFMTGCLKCVCLSVLQAETFAGKQ